MALMTFWPFGNIPGPYGLVGGLLCNLRIQLIEEHIYAQPPATRSRLSLYKLFILRLWCFLAQQCTTLSKLLQRCMTFESFAQSVVTCTTIVVTIFYENFFSLQSSRCVSTQ